MTKRKKKRKQVMDKGPETIKMIYNTSFFMCLISVFLLVGYYILSMINGSEGYNAEHIYSFLFPAGILIMGLSNIMMIFFERGKLSSEKMKSRNYSMLRILVSLLIVLMVLYRRENLRNLILILTSISVLYFGLILTTKKISVNGLVFGYIGILEIFFTSVFVFIFKDDSYGFISIYKMIIALQTSTLISHFILKTKLKRVENIEKILSIVIAVMCLTVFIIITGFTRGRSATFSFTFVGGSMIIYHLSSLVFFIYHKSTQRKIIT